MIDLVKDDLQRMEKIRVLLKSTLVSGLELADAVSRFNESDALAFIHCVIRMRGPKFIPVLVGALDVLVLPETKGADVPRIGAYLRGALNEVERSRLREILL